MGDKEEQKNQSPENDENDENHDKEQKNQPSDNDKNDKNDKNDENDSNDNDKNEDKASDDMASSNEINKEESENKEDKKIRFTVEDIESIPNIEQMVHHDDIKCDIDCDNMWCPKLGYKPYDDLIWTKFLKGDELFINQRLKMIPKIVEGSWYFTFPQRPALLGMKTPQRCYRGINYLEIDCEADQSLIASQITKAAYHISTYLVVDIMLTIEGRSDNELPERCIGGFQIRYVDSTKAIKLINKDNHNTQSDDNVE